MRWLINPVVVNLNIPKVYTRLGLLFFLLLFPFFRSKTRVDYRRPKTFLLRGTLNLNYSTRYMYYTFFEATPNGTPDRPPTCPYAHVYVFYYVIYFYLRSTIKTRYMLCLRISDTIQYIITTDTGGKKTDFHNWHLDFRSIFFVNP